MSQQAVLVVEADTAARHDLGDFLRDRGYQCVLVSSVQEALEPLAHATFSSRSCTSNPTGRMASTSCIA